MMRLFVLICMAALIASCDNLPMEYSKSQGPINVAVGERTYKVIKFEYDGHKYIKFGYGEGSNIGSIAIVHDPDCAKCRTNKTKWYE